MTVVYIILGLFTIAFAVITMVAVLGLCIITAVINRTIDKL